MAAVPLQGNVMLSWREINLFAQLSGLDVRAWTFRVGRDEGDVMPMGREFRAISREAQGLPAAALIIGGLLLLTVP